VWALRPAQLEGRPLSEAIGEPDTEVVGEAENGESALAPAVASRLIRRARAPANETLSGRELELVVAGLSATNTEHYHRALQTDQHRGERACRRPQTA
jgi:hypothetical protein